MSIKGHVRFHRPCLPMTSSRISLCLLIFPSAFCAHSFLPLPYHAANPVFVCVCFFSYVFEGGNPKIVPSFLNLCLFTPSQHDKMIQVFEAWFQTLGVQNLFQSGMLHMFIWRAIRSDVWRPRIHMSKGTHTQESQLSENTRHSKQTAKLFLQ